MQHAIYFELPKDQRNLEIDFQMVELECFNWGGAKVVASFLLCDQLCRGKMQKLIL